MDNDRPGHQISIVDCENVFVGDYITVVLKVPGTQGMSKSCVKIMTTVNVQTIQAREKQFMIGGLKIHISDKVPRGGAHSGNF